ncbi:MAG: GtrA family protein, partial [Eubacteriales bacterium]|nr:GtrA family protein [Eubacteriales bacterium]
MTGAHAQTALARLYRRHRAWMRNLALYGCIGGLAAVVDFGCFYLLNTGLSVNRYAANILSMHMGMLVSFALNSSMNFKKTDRLLQRFLSYYAIVLCGMGLSSLLLWAGGFVIGSGTV